MSDEFKRRSWTAAAIAVGLVAAAAAAWAARDLLLLIFAGILVAQLLLGLTGALRRRLGWSHKWALTAVCLALAAVVVIGVVLLAPPVAEQARSLSESLPRSYARAREALRGTQVGSWLGGTLPPPDDLRDMLSRTVKRSDVTGFLSTTVGAVGSAVLIAFLGLFFAARPATYRDGLVCLVPPGGRARACEVLGRMAETLRGWLLGKAVSMTIVGVSSALGLWLLGIPLALTLGLLAALLGFIPNFGPVLAVVPAALVALSQGASAAGYVVLLYLGIQTIESYVVTPLVQQRTTSLPPGAVLSAQLILGGLLGALGLALATPLFAAARVLVEMVYVQDTLHEEETAAEEPAADG